jgi:hypothetical protein
MESRFRKLLSPRKHKARRSDSTAELDLHSIPYTTTPAQGWTTEPGDLHARRSSTAKKHDNSAPTERLRSLSYDEAPPGTPPDFGIRPHRGNGPVKLQTSRRLSSGEFLVTEQDYDQTLEEIREGEFVMGGKDRRTSTRVKSPTDPARLRVMTSAPSSPRNKTASLQSSWAPTSALSDTTLVASTVSVTGSFPGLGRSLSSQASQQPYKSHSSKTTNGLGISGSTQQLFPRHMASTTSLVSTNESNNPTIQALCKAEYSRLVNIYGQTTVDKTMLDAKQDELMPARTSSSTRNPAPPAKFSPFPSPYQSQSQPQSTTLATGTSVNASSSSVDLPLQVHSSDGTSFPRYARISSTDAEPSRTATLGVVEEPALTRDDIRKIVSDMRANYLHAIEAHTPPFQLPPDLPAKKTRSVKKTPSLVSNASVDGSLRAASQRSSGRTTSWQSATSHISANRSSLSSFPMKSQRPTSSKSRRASGQPVAGIATLPAIQASPGRSSEPKKAEKQDDVGLKRADSTTLGIMARKLTIVDDRNSTGSSQATYKSSPTFYTSSGSESEASLPEPVSPISSPKLSPTKAPSSVQQTPEKQKISLLSTGSSIPKSSWQVNVDKILAKDEVEMALDIDDFETLCDGLFNSVASENHSQLPMFENFSSSLTAKSAKPPQRAPPPVPLTLGRLPELRESRFASDKIFDLVLKDLPKAI